MTCLYVYVSTWKAYFVRQIIQNLEISKEITRCFVGLLGGFGAVLGLASYCLGHFTTL